MSTLEMIQLAQSHAFNGAIMASSAQCCCEDAMAQYVKGHNASALMWAAKSLSYSVGIFHPDYEAVQRARG